MPSYQLSISLREHFCPNNPTALHRPQANNLNKLRGVWASSTPTTARQQHLQPNMCGNSPCTLLTCRISLLHKEFEFQHTEYAVVGLPVVVLPKDTFLFHQACSRRSPGCWPIGPFTMIQKMFAVFDLFVIGLLNSFVPNVESLAVTSLPGGLKSAFILYSLYG